MILRPARRRCPPPDPALREQSVIAHLLTASRMAFAAGFAAGAAATIHQGRLVLQAALLLAGLALAEEVTDALDGIVARRTGTASAIGGVFDPLSDSLSRLAIYFSLALTGCLSIAVPLVMAGRDIVVAYTRIINAMTGGRTSARLSGKVKAVVQGGGIFAVLAAASALESGSAPSVFVRRACETVLIAVTAWSLADYVIGTFRHARAAGRV